MAATVRPTPSVLTVSGARSDVDGPLIPGTTAPGRSVLPDVTVATSASGGAVLTG